MKKLGVRLGACPICGKDVYSKEEKDSFGRSCPTWATVIFPKKIYNSKVCHFHDTKEKPCFGLSMKSLEKNYGHNYGIELESPSTPFGKIKIKMTPKSPL